MVKARKQLQRRKKKLGLWEINFINVNSWLLGGRVLSLFITIVKLSLAILRKSQNLWDKRLQVYPFYFCSMADMLPYKFTLIIKK